MTNKYENSPLVECVECPYRTTRLQRGYETDLNPRTRIVVGDVELSDARYCDEVFCLIERPTENPNGSRSMLTLLNIKNFG